MKSIMKIVLVIMVFVFFGCFNSSKINEIEGRWRGAGKSAYAEFIFKVKKDVVSGSLNMLNKSGDLSGMKFPITKVKYSDGNLKFAIVMPASSRTKKTINFNLSLKDGKLDGYTQRQSEGNRDKPKKDPMVLVKQK